MADITPDDGLDMPARQPVAQMPPHLYTQMQDAEREIASAQSDWDSALEETIASAGAEIAAQQSGVNTEIQALIGAADLEFRAAESDLWESIGKQVVAAERAIVGAQMELESVGVPMPRSSDDIARELEEDTGETIINRLAGIAPGQTTSPAPAPNPAPVPGENPPVPIVAVGAMPTPVESFGGVPPPPQEPIPPRPIPIPVSGGQYVLKPVPVPVPAPVPPQTIRTAPVECPAPAPTCPAPVVQCPTTPVDVHVHVEMPEEKHAQPVEPPPVIPTVGGTVPIGLHGVPPGYSMLWAAPNICDLLTAQAKERKVVQLPGNEGFRPPPDFVIDTPLEAAQSVWSLFETGWENASTWVSSVWKDHAAQKLVGEWATLLAGNLAAGPVIDALDPVGVRDRESTQRLVAKLGLAAFSEEKSGLPLSYLVQTERYLMQYLSPMYIPEQTALDNAYLHNIISAAQWQCLTMSHGNVPETAKWGVESAQVRPGVGETVELYQRGVIKSPEELEARLRQLGVLDKKFVNEFWRLAQWIPQPPDIVRFMVRDVFDPDAVRRAGLDTDFEKKFYGGDTVDENAPAAKWARAHGLDAEAFRLFWRAHWELPSPTQLYEMLHRLRADRPEVVQWDKFAEQWGIPAAIAQFGERPPVVTPKDAREMLAQQDIAPAWIEKLMAVSYRPMTRTDALGAFHANVMSGEELGQRLQDTGLDRATADRTVQLQESLRARRMANVSGVWTVRKVCKAYSAGAVSRNDAFMLLDAILPDPDQRRNILDGVDRERESDTRAKGIARQRRALITGEHSDAIIHANLVTLGVDRYVADQLVAGWIQDRDGRYKEPTARMVSDWIKHRIIATQTALERLRRVGYGEVDAQMIVTTALAEAAKSVEQDKRTLRSEIKHIIKDEADARKATVRDLTNREKEIAREVARLDRERARIRGELDDRIPDTEGQ